MNQKLQFPFAEFYSLPRMIAFSLSMCALIGLCIVPAACTTAQLQTASNDIGVISADANTLFTAFKSSGLLNSSTLTGLNTLKSELTQYGGAYLTDAGQIVTGIQSVDAVIAPYFKTGSTAATDLATVNSLISLVQTAISAASNHVTNGFNTVAWIVFKENL